MISLHNLKVELLVDPIFKPFFSHLLLFFEDLVTIIVYQSLYKNISVEDIKKCVVFQTLHPSCTVFLLAGQLMVSEETPGLIVYDI